MRYLAAILITVLLAAGCSNSSETDRPSSDPSVPEELGFGGPDGALRIAMVKPATTLPAQLVLTDQAQVVVSDLLYDGLTEVDARSGRLRPGLATSWTSNDDFTSWVFTLDTERVSAAEVKDNFDRQAGSTSGIVRDLLSNVESVETIAGTQVRFKLSAPAAGFAWLLSGPGMAVVLGDDGPTGRMRLISSDANGMVFGSPNGLADIDIRWTSSETEAATLLERGDVDVAIADRVTTGEATSDDVLGHVRFLALNAASPGLADGATRSRVQTAVAEVVDVPADTQDTLVPIDGLTSPALAGSSSTLCLDVCAVADEAPAALGPEVTMRLGVSSEADVVLAQALERRLQDSGVSFDILVETPEGLAAKIASGQVDLFMFGWIAGAGSVDAALPALLDSESPAHVFQLRDSSVDQKLSEAAEIDDDEARWKAMSEAEELAMSKYVAVPLGAMRSKVVKGPRAKSLVVRSDGTLDTFRY